MGNLNTSISNPKAINHDKRWVGPGSTGYIDILSLSILTNLYRIKISDDHNIIMLEIRTLNLVHLN